MRERCLQCAELDGEIEAMIPVGIRPLSVAFSCCGVDERANAWGKCATIISFCSDVGFHVWLDRVIVTSTILVQ